MKKERNFYRKNIKRLLIFIIFIMTVMFFYQTSSASFVNTYISNFNTSFKRMNTVLYKGLIINVPIDSRPISTSNFETLVKAAGYNYVEMNSYLDSMGEDENYQLGDSEKLRESVSEAFKYNDGNNTNINYNTEDTTVIINLSSYFFGGLIGARGDSAYADIDNKINELTNLINTYNNAKYYIVIGIPRTLPDSRVVEFPENIYPDTQVKSLVDYYNESTGNSINSDRSFIQAVSIWSYFRYWQKFDGHKYEDLPEYARNFCNDFYNEYRDFLEKYDSIYRNTQKYIEYLIKMKASLPNQGENVEIVIGEDDCSLPAFFEWFIWSAGDNYFNYLERDEYNNLIKYNVTTYMEQLFKNEDCTIIPGMDEINHMILAKELVEETEVGISFNYLDPSTGNAVSDIYLNRKGNYENKTIKENLEIRENFINEGAKKEILVDTYLVHFPEQNGYAPQYDLPKEDAYKVANIIYENKNNKSVIGVYEFDNNLLEALVNNGNIFELSYCSAWNTIGNSLGIGLASIAVEEITKYEVSDVLIMQTNLLERIQKCMEYRVKTVLEGAIYNKNKNPAWYSYIEENNANIDGRVLAERISYLRRSRKSITNCNKSYKRITI